MGIVETKKIISKGTAINKIRELHRKSSLFITKTLVDFAVKEIREYRKS